jgi:hypothetical protein
MSFLLVQKELRRALAMMLFLATIPSTGRGQNPETPQTRSTAVEVRAVVSTSVPRVTLHWNASAFTPTGITVYRRAAGAGSWGAGTTLAASALTYADPTAAAGVRYEYKIVRQQADAFSPFAEGYLWSGVNIPAVTERGRIILIIDDTMSGPLAPEITRLISDLTGDGWLMAWSEVSRTATVPAVKAIIKTRYNESPSNTKAVFLLGHVPVPYSGNVCPDGHWELPPLPHHRGAWPADAYYGDMDGVWTDTTVNYTVANVDTARPTVNHNVPGDGKFDQSLLVGQHLPELAVGRVDLANMDGMSGGVPEVTLLRRYLDRHHAFRHRLAPFTTLGERALVDNNFDYFEGLGFAASGWASGIALFGNGATNEISDWVATLRDQNYLLAYGCGPGSFYNAENVSDIFDYRDTRTRAVFQMLFGSFFGDWDKYDTYLRAPLVGTTDSHGLVSVWSGVPKWQFFPLAAGGTMADAYRHVIHEVNQPGGPFPPTDESWTNPDQTHVAIMGDPVLRLQPVKPVINVNLSRSGNTVTLNWTNPVGETDFLGCRVYRSSSEVGPFLQIGSQTGAGVTGYADTLPAAGTYYYMVRAIKRQTTASATYENPAQGVFASVQFNDFDVWAAGLSDVSLSGDPNRDGVSNLLAYAIGAADGNEVAVGRLPRPTTNGGFTLAQSPRTDIHYAFQISRDLEAWYSVVIKPPGSPWILNPGSGYQNQANISVSGTSPVTVNDSTPLTRRFWRLKLSQ